MKEECRNCKHAQNSYKGIRCELKNKKVRVTDTCTNFRKRGKCDG